MTLTGSPSRPVRAGRGDVDVLVSAQLSDVLDVGPVFEADVGARDRSWGQGGSRTTAVTL